MRFTDEIEETYKVICRTYSRSIPSMNFASPQLSVHQRYPERFTVEFGPFTPWMYQNYDLWPSQSLSLDGGIDIDPELQGIGLGRSLQEARERICKRLGITTILINQCDNPGFWDHMGFEEVRDNEREHFRSLGIKVAEEAMIRRL